MENLVINFAAKLIYFDKILALKPSTSGRHGEDEEEREQQQQRPSTARGSARQLGPAHGTAVRHSVRPVQLLLSSKAQEEEEAKEQRRDNGLRWEVSLNG